MDALDDPDLARGIGQAKAKVESARVVIRPPAETSWPMRNSALYCLVWAVALVVVFAPLATRLYRRAGAR